MGLSDLFANNLFVKLLRGDRAKHDLIVSMVGTRLGDRVLVLGGGDGELVAALGRPTGLTGRVCAVEPDEARAERVRSSATAAGVLLEVETAAPGSLPYDAGSFDVVVVPPAADVTESMSEVWRVLRSGGRCVVLGTRDASAAVLDRLKRAGFPVPRLIAERDKLAFYEALKLG